MTTYRIEITGRALSFRDTAAEAIHHAAGQLYLSPEGKAEAERQLAAGQPYSWSYGFNDATIRPIDITPSCPVSNPAAILKGFREAHTPIGIRFEL